MQATARLASVVSSTLPAPRRPIRSVMPMKPIAERPLRHDESEVIRWMLKHASTRGTLDQLLSSVQNLRIVGAYECGCPSIDFVSQDETVGSAVIAEALCTSPEGVDAGLMIWAKEDAIVGFEAYNFGDVVPFSLPSVETLRPFPELAKA